MLLLLELDIVFAVVISLPNLRVGMILLSLVFVAGVVGVEVVFKVSNPPPNVGNGLLEEASPPIVLPFGRVVVACRGKKSELLLTSELLSTLEDADDVVDMEFVVDDDPNENGRGVGTLVPDADVEVVIPPWLSLFLSVSPNENVVEEDMVWL